VARVTARDGYLVLGAAETVVGLADSFNVVADKRGLYVPNMNRPKSAYAAPKFAPPRLVAVNGGR
jgi:chemotaxis protein methyltransferase CheR